jgi:glycyl-tRNA synthetase beta chain
VSIRPRWGELPLRLAAVRAFQKLPEAVSLAAANKRIGNILKKSDHAAGDIDTSRLVESAERALSAAVQSARPAFDVLYAANDYSGALQSLAQLKVPVDAFFDGVMVNVDDAKLRENRLALLADLHALMNKVADLSKLAA